MKRRSFGLLAGSSLVALNAGRAVAQVVGVANPKDPTLLTTTLTPMGAEREGNADGSIPRWTGGYTTVPAGWQPGQSMPDFFADEQPVVVIDASNMAGHADKLSDGVMAMMQKFGFSIKVYPTHRTACAPQKIYDNIAANLSTAQLDPRGPRWGFINAFGGIPFPIPDTSDALAAGSQIIWNHQARWAGYAYRYLSQCWSVSGGNLQLGQKGWSDEDFPYYYREDLKQLGIRIAITYVGPPNVVGEEITVWDSTDPAKNPNIAWELLNGQGRVRKTPELSFDTPSSTTDGIANYDEYTGFIQSQEKYDFTFIEKKEQYIPYNNNGMILLPAEKVHLEHFLDPNVVRWELHRVWVVEAKLHPGERDVLARRKFYVDEDTWTIGCEDCWDANDNLYHVNTIYNRPRPELPGTIYANNCVTNMQTGDYATLDGPWDQLANPNFQFEPGFPDSTYDPQSMAAAGQY